MNKPAQIRTELTDPLAGNHEINRNLSPSFAKIRARARAVSSPNRPTPEPPKNQETPDSIQRKEPNSRATPPSQAQPTSPPTTLAPGIPDKSRAFSTSLATPAPTSSPPRPANSTRITPWLIASITLTLALFSGNYAWHTQQRVETLNLRLDQFEAQAAAALTTRLPENDETGAKTAQTLVTLQQTQGQFAASVATLQNTLTTDTEQASSRLTALETALADLSSQLEVLNRNREEDKAQLAKTIEKKRSKAKPTDPTRSEATSSTNNWFINIASFSDARAASSSHEKVQTIAASASIKPVAVNGKTLYRIRADGYSSRQGAERAAQALQTQLGLSGLWVSRD